MLAYLARYTHRVAISNRRLIALDEKGVTFTWKDYRIEGRERYKMMTLDTNEFIRRFLMHVLPQGFHRIRHYGLLANTARADNIARARELLAVPMLPIDAINAATLPKANEPQTPEHPCPCCGGRMIIIETFERGSSPQISPAANTRNQDRHVMSTLAEPRRRKADRLLRWFPTGHDGACGNMTSTPLIARQSSIIDPAIPLESKPLPSANPRNHRDRSRCPHSTCRSAALNSP